MQSHGTSRVSRIVRIENLINHKRSAVFGIQKFCSYGSHVAEFAAGQADSQRNDFPYFLHFNSLVIDKPLIHLCEFHSMGIRSKRKIYSMYVVK